MMGSLKRAVFGPRISKPADKKTANNEGPLYPQKNKTCITAVVLKLGILLKVALQYLCWKHKLLNWMKAYFYGRTFGEIHPALLLFLRLLTKLSLNFLCGVGAGGGGKKNKVLSLSREKFLREEKEIDRTCHIQKCYNMPPTEKNHLAFFVSQKN
jgi:hypothetical protein